MKAKEAMKALLDGQCLCLKHGGDYLKLNDKGGLEWQDGTPAHLVGDIDYVIYESPNPHAKGTFAWAREEARRGRRVRRPHHRLEVRFFGPDAWLQIQDFDATDWGPVE